MASFILMLLTGFMGLYAGQSSLEISGDVNANVPKAFASAAYMKAIKIWNVRVSTPYPEYNASGKGYTANLFFNKNFTLATKTYPIAFSYLNKQDTAGGTFFIRSKGKRIPGFIYDTKGELTITKTGDTVEGTFSFTCATRGKKSPKKTVKVSGTFSIPMKPGFPSSPPPQ